MTSQNPTTSGWVRESNLSWYHRWVVKVLKAGPVPNHVAFIMDGNRRFAQKEKIAKAEGHSKGFDKLSETLQWCQDIGIREVTVYAFSIENFKRTKEEVDTLMSLAREKFKKLLEERDKLHERGICIRIIGNTNMLPLDIQHLLAEAVLLTKNNTNAFLNVAFAYTSRDEMAHSIRTVAEGVAEGKLHHDDIDEHLLSRCMYTKHCSEPDLLVRTSGEVRLSDFLLWQSGSAVIYFTETLWPEFNVWHLFGAVFYYQRCHWRMTSIQDSLTGDGKETDAESTMISGDSLHQPEQMKEKAERVKSFLDEVERKDHEKLVKLTSAISLD
ncbi:dehydrodolichyl diphosphate synthase complex subunit DHDDS [Uranotaenia lowii]|uniref:dehydrodolichyl diphosphate synthase complex subunit DHDDS n=1 Tax=Uranotaenia lowii TaxID=190385 RepID=UPI002478608F|nr:dehydrodolichyl diphosphate synthase complex subunit DHDDS [Uranotaenia lowii]XP_055608075.1 dehydrodolichyl diphosphate synthase complex subunit DHDDS [Uranotaenia lowii]